MTAYSFKNTTIKDMTHSGAYGNCAIWDTTLPVGGLAGLTTTTGDTIAIQAIKIPEGALINRIQWGNTAFGTGSVMNVGFIYDDTYQTVPSDSAAVSANCFLSNQTIATATSGELLLPFPIHFTIPARIVVTLSGATGEQFPKTVASLYLALQGKSMGA